MATRNIVPAYEVPRQRMMPDGSIVDTNGNVVYRPSGPVTFAQDNYKAQVGNAAQRQAQASTTRMATADNPLQRARDAANDPKLQLQQDRLKLEQQRFADQQRRDAEKRRADQQKAKTKPASGGRGGRGGGGSRGKSPEDKARDKAREAKQTQLENQKMNRRDENTWAQSQGYGSMDEYNRAQEREAFFNRGKDNTSNSGRGNERGNNNSPGGDPSYGPGTGGSNDTTGDAAAAAGMYNFLNSMNPQGSANSSSGSGGGRRMTHAYGNKHAKLVRARGDLA